MRAESTMAVGLGATAGTASGCLPQPGRHAIARDAMATLATRINVIRPPRLCCPRTGATLARGAGRARLCMRLNSIGSERPKAHIGASLSSFAAGEFMHDVNLLIGGKEQAASGGATFERR